MARPRLRHRVGRAGLHRRRGSHRRPPAAIPLLRAGYMRAMALREVEVGRVTPEAFADVAGPERQTEFVEAGHRARRLLAGRRVWSINSTASGGGVAELLHVLLAYAKGAGV